MTAMLRVASAIHGFKISALDGLIGHVDDVLFDDDTWLVRWVVVRTGGWLDNRKVLLPTLCLGHIDTEQKEFSVLLDKEQVKDSPNVDTDKSVSRQMETNVYDYYGWTPYWGSGLYMGGAGFWGDAGGLPSAALSPASADEPHGEDPHLRSAAALGGYHIHARDGEIGHVKDLLMDDADWSIRYLVIDTANWWAGKTVVLSPRSIESIDWASREVRIYPDRAKVQNSPAYTDPGTTTRAYSRTFHNYYADVIS
jgi:hypothetical protein